MRRGKAVNISRAAEGATGKGCEACGGRRPPAVFPCLGGPAEAACPVPPLLPEHPQYVAGQMSLLETSQGQEPATGKAARTPHGLPISLPCHCCQNPSTGSRRGAARPLTPTCTAALVPETFPNSSFDCTRSKQMETVKALVTEYVLHKKNEISYQAAPLLCIQA